MKTISTIITVLLLCLSAQAAKITVVKQNKALIDLEGESFNPGDKLFAVDEQGKKKAILVIKQVKNGKAVAEVLKGAAQKDFSVIMGKAAGSSSVASGGKSRRGGKSNSGWGIMAGYAMNKMTAKPTPTTSVDLSGTSFNLKGFYQMKLDGAIGVKASAGYESLVASGTSATAACTSSTSCDVNIGYLGLDALVTYDFTNSGSFRFWGGAGLGFLLALSKSSNVLDTGKISTNQTILISLGTDIDMGGGSFIPVQFDYALYPSNNTTSANQMILRAGYGWSF